MIEVSLLFCFAFYTADANNAQLSYAATVQSDIARAPYIVLLEPKPLIEDGNLQVYRCTVCMHEKEPRSPQTHFRACKISKFPGDVPPDPPHTIHFLGPICPGLLQSSWRP